jgi:hypothetical protein
MGITLGWFSDAAILDSWRKRARKTSSVDSSGESTLRATELPIRGFSAWKTTLIPPRPSTDSRR